jgi:tetratricopeptide (TPR) repeat protein
MRCRKNSQLRLNLLAAALVVALAVPALAQSAADRERLLKQADQYMLDGKLGQARQLYERALRAGASFDNDADRARNLGVCLMQQPPTDFVRAARMLETALRLRPDEETRALLAQALGWGGKHAAAAEHYRVLVKARPAKEEYVTGLASVLQWASDLEGAADALRVYLERNPGNARMRVEYARVLSYQKKYVESMAEYQAVLQADPNNLPAQIGMARVTSWQPDLPKALEMYDNILKRHRNLYDAIVGKAYTLMWMGRGEEARPLFQQALRRQPGDKEVAAALKELGPPKPKTEVAEAKPETPAEPKEPSAEFARTPGPPPQPAPVQEPPKPVDPVPALLNAAEAAAAQGNYAAAIHNYYQVLAHDPQHQGAQLQIARVLSWSKAYDDAIKQYDVVLASQPNHTAARLEKARVLSWAQRYDESLAEYGKVIQSVETARQQQQPAPAEIKEVRLETARVFSWARRFDEALEQLSIVLPPDKQPAPEDKPVLITRARIFSWSQRYQEAIADYDKALEIDPGDFEARFGKAQSLYWSGQLGYAAMLLRPMYEEQPPNPDVTYTLAAVEHGMGHNGRALYLLDKTPDHSDARLLATTIRNGLRPTLHIRYGLENSRELPASLFVGPSTLRVPRYTGRIEFYPHPDVRMDVWTSVGNPGSSNALLGRHASDAIATETMGRVHFRVTPWLMMSLGAGQGSTGGAALGAGVPRTQHFLYEVHPVITRGGFRLDVVATRRAADYTPLAVHSNVVQRRESVSASYTWNKRVRFIGEYFHANYRIHSPAPDRRFTAVSNGGVFAVTPILYQDDRFLIEAGGRVELVGFNEAKARAILDPVTGIDSGGFFMPRFYQRYAATGHVNLTPHPRVTFDATITYGPQRVLNFDNLGGRFVGTSTFASQVTFNLGDFRPYVSYDFFTTSTPAFGQIVDGSYRTHAFAVGFAWRF